MNTDGRSVVAALGRSHLELCGATRGAFAAVAVDGSVLWTWGLDAETTTVFRMASMTKSFTAALVLSLRDEGIVGLDDPIAIHAPEFGTIIGPGTDPAPITLRHLLTMSSGLTTDDPWADRHLNASDDDLDQWVSAGLRFAYPTGTAFEYSNLGYVLIGRVVHRATGRQVQDLVKERFLVPLGMTHTAWAIHALPEDADVTQGMHPGDGGPQPEPPLGDGVVAPMGGLWSCTQDLCRWISFLSSAFTEAPLPGGLAARSRREMQQLHRGWSPHTDRTPDGAIRTEVGGYAMGLTTYRDEHLGWAVSHSGGLPGYGSNMRWIPGGIGIVALANITYAPMRHATAAILNALAVADLLAPTAHTPSTQSTPSTPSTQSTASTVHSDVLNASERFARLLGHWDDSEAADVFADNVLLDESATIQRREIATRWDDGTVVQLLGVEPDGGAAAILTVIADTQLHRLRVELAPLARPLIQAYEWL